MSDRKIVTKEIFLGGCKFFYKDGNDLLISNPLIDYRGNPGISLLEFEGNHFASVGKVDKSGFNWYTFRLGKRFSGRVLFKDLSLIKKEVSNG